MVYRVIGASGTAFVEQATLLGAVFYALTCSVREDEAYAIADADRTVALAFRGRLYAGSREIAVDELVRIEAAARAGRGPEGPMSAGAPRACACGAHAAATGRAPTCSIAETSCAVSTGLTSHRPANSAASALEAGAPLMTSTRLASSGRCATTWR